jgi:hypothetical protein
MMMDFEEFVEELHPDKGGNPEEFVEMQRQYKIEMSKFEPIFINERGGKGK